MASSGVDIPGSAMAEAIIADHDRKSFQKEKNSGPDEKVLYSSNSDDDVSVKIVHDHTHRQLRPRHIQLIGIGGTIGTALYVAIGRALLQGGPGSLFHYLVCPLEVDSQELGRSLCQTSVGCANQDSSNVAGNEFQANHHISGVPLLPLSLRVSPKW